MEKQLIWVFEWRKSVHYWWSNILFSPGCKELTSMLDPLLYRWGVPPVVIRGVHWTMQMGVLLTLIMAQSTDIVMGLVLLCNNLLLKCWFIIIPPPPPPPPHTHTHTHTQRSCWGVYWFHSVRPSVRPASRVRSVTSTVQDGFFSYMAQMINSMRGCVAYDDPWPWPIFSRSFGLDLANRVRSVASTVLDGFFLYLAQMITIIRGCVACLDFSESANLNFWQIF